MNYFLLCLTNIICALIFIGVSNYLNMPPFPAIPNTVVAILFLTKKEEITKK